MRHTGITSNNTVFILLSFEGPDRYSLAGGLGVRVTNLCATLSQKGFFSHLFFVGDPKGIGEEPVNGGRLTLHRWCQWISEYFPGGVYQGEYDKLRNYSASIPGWVIDHVVKPAVREGCMIVVLAEEWHTAEAVCLLHDELTRSGIRDRVVMFWNANNTFGFDRINWKRLASSATITTVSRYMKHIMWGLGVNPLVTPNGIPKTLLERVDEGESAHLREVLDADLVITKVARFDPDKCWNMAVEATARLKETGMDAVLVARGGVEPHGAEVFARARSLGLKIKDVDVLGDKTEDYFQALSRREGADILNVRFHCPQSFLRVMYHASDAVLANSGHEPFGLVGLETMAAGGVAFIGSTGEDYAVPFRNSIVLETADPKEIEANIIYLRERPDDEEKIRRSARHTAREFTWERVIENLVRKIEYQARSQGLIAPCDEAAAIEPTEAEDIVPGANNQERKAEMEPIAAR